MSSIPVGFYEYLTMRIIRNPAYLEKEPKDP